MARIRSIKADLSEDERFETISEPAMLLFLLLKPHADDTGVICIDKMQVIRSKAYTVREDVSIQMVRDRMDELEEHDFIRTFHVGNNKYAALDFSDERIDKPRAGILQNGPNFHTLTAKKEQSGSVSNTPDASGTVATLLATGSDNGGIVANDPATGADISGTSRDDSGKGENVREHSGSVANVPAGEERKGVGEGVGKESSSSSSVRTHAGAGVPARVDGAESPTTAGPQGTSGPDRKAPQEPLDKSANRAEPVYRESGKKLQVDSIPTEPLPLPEALELYLISTRLQKNREELMMATGLADLPYLKLWGLEFNSHLLTEGREDTKVMMDYCSHFSRWLKKQPTHTHPDPKTFNAEKEDAKRTSSNPASAGSGNSNKPSKAALAKTSSRTRNQYLDEQ